MTRKSGLSIGFYIPSYNRFDGAIPTLELIEDPTLVVRKSQEKEYKRFGVKVWAVPDEEIDSLAKVRQYIIDNAPEDLVVQLDDDISFMAYVFKDNYEPIRDKERCTYELTRWGQMIADLGLGVAASQMNHNVMQVNAEFIWKGCVGGVLVFNRECMKSRYDTNVRFSCDIDMMLQELLANRIILVPSYMGIHSEYDRNKGGNNDQKTMDRRKAQVEYLRNKWGSHYAFNFKSNRPKIHVKR